MPVTFLGYQVLDFVNNDGDAVKGIKFFFMYESDKRNYKGFEVSSYFADFLRDRILYDIVQKCVPGERYVLDLTPSFSGKTKINNLTPIK